MFFDPRYELRQSMPAVFLGIALLFVAGWWLASGRAGTGLQPLAVPLAVAMATPFVLRPLEATWSPALIAIEGILLPIAMLPLALGLQDRIVDVAERRLVAQVTAALSIAAVFVGIGLASTEPWSGAGLARWALVGAIPLIPGLAAAGPIQPGGLLAGGTSTGRLLESTEFAVAGATPLFALSTDSSPYIFPFALWIGLILVAGRFTVRPLARLATRAQLQRDLVVAATEAERARVAADIHDDALQELTLLIQRLDAAGDAEGAGIARTVSDRLRAICGDLRLPILDDLGVGPALDWLVLRIERLAGGEVRLERSDGARPPADVELAFFRVAQEALANAVKHGRPPIVVRYAATTSGVSLSIDDAGPGIEPDAGDAADQSGHFGLLNMQQRAEAIGAILDVRRWPAGGTPGALEWRAH
jgi:signal transduction histidine kinase